MIDCSERHCVADVIVHHRDRRSTIVSEPVWWWWWFLETGRPVLYDSDTMCSKCSECCQGSRHSVDASPTPGSDSDISGRYGRRSRRNATARRIGKHLTQTLTKTKEKALDSVFF
ncbi:uncharacterized protein LOC143358822 [Halictus rubicundus]|uniref:uncharacterized protein LOC143358822 n=1 Tax=Halictus rubicundus TaxID=77578 RepID=UPI004035280C